MPVLIHATLNPSGPHFKEWMDILGYSRVPIKSARPLKAALGEEKDVEVYLLNLEAMPLKQRARLIGFVAQKFGVLVSEVEAEIRERGFPIRAADVVVAHELSCVRMTGLILAFAFLCLCVLLHALERRGYHRGRKAGYDLGYEQGHRECDQWWIRSEEAADVVERTIEKGRWP